MLHSTRWQIGVKYKSLTSSSKLKEIYERNINKYGDKLDPTIDYLRKQGKSWKDIIKSTSKPGGKDINFKK